MTQISIDLIVGPLHADDCNLVTHSQRPLQLLIDCSPSACDDVGLTISVYKTIIILQTEPGKPFILLSIYVKGKRLEVVDMVVYHGSTLSTSNLLDEQISYKLLKASDVFCKT